MKNGKVSVDGLIWRKPNGRYIEEIHIRGLTDKVIERESDKVVLSAFTILSESVWQSGRDAKRINAYESLDRLEQVVEDLLVNAGWEVNVVNSLKETRTEDYLHSTGGALQVHQVPFSAETNIKLELDELCDRSGSIRTKEVTLALLKDRIGVDTFDIEELSEEDRSYVLAIMQREELDLEDLHDVTGQELTTGAQTFEWFRDDEEAQQEARDYLTDDSYLWKKAVAAGNTIDGLEEWAEDAIRIDGWAQIICSYDSMERVAQLKDGTWFPYLRSN